MSVRRLNSSRRTPFRPVAARRPIRSFRVAATPNRGASPRIHHDEQRRLNPAVDHRAGAGFRSARIPPWSSAQNSVPAPPRPPSASLPMAADAPPRLPLRRRPSGACAPLARRRLEHCIDGRFRLPFEPGRPMVSSCGDAGIRPGKARLPLAGDVLSAKTPGSDGDTPPQIPST